MLITNMEIVQLSRSSKHLSWSGFCGRVSCWLSGATMPLMCFSGDVSCLGPWPFSSWNSSCSAAPVRCERS